MRKYRKRNKPPQPADMIERHKLAEMRVKELRCNITNSEMRIMRLLNDLPFSYTFQYAMYNEWYFMIADFWLPVCKIMIEVDGNSHFNLESRKREAKRKRWLKSLGIEVLRIKNSATKEMTSRQLNDRIIRVITKRIKNES